MRPYLYFFSVLALISCAKEDEKLPAEPDPEITYSEPQSISIDFSDSFSGSYHKLTPLANNLKLVSHHAHIYVTGLTALSAAGDSVAWQHEFLSKDPVDLFITDDHLYLLSFYDNLTLHDPGTGQELSTLKGPPHELHFMKVVGDQLYAVTVDPASNHSYLYRLVDNQSWELIFQTGSTGLDNLYLIEDLQMIDGEVQLFISEKFEAIANPSYLISLEPQTLNADTLKTFGNYSVEAFEKKDQNFYFKSDDQLFHLDHQSQLIDSLLSGREVELPMKRLKNGVWLEYSQRNSELRALSAEGKKLWGRDYLRVDGDVIFEDFLFYTLRYEGQIRFADLKTGKDYSLGLEDQIEEEFYSSLVKGDTLYMFSENRVYYSTLTILNN